MTGRELVEQFQQRGTVTIGFSIWHYLGFTAALFFALCCLLGAVQSWFSFETPFLVLLGVGFGIWSIRGLLKPSNPANYLVIDVIGVHFQGKTYPWGKIRSVNAVRPLHDNWRFYNLSLSGRRLGTSMHDIPGRQLADALNWLLRNR